jgi:hypothetical protein
MLWCSYFLVRGCSFATNGMAGTGENHLAVVVLGTFQSSLRDFSVLVAYTQDCRPGYMQPSLRDWVAHLKPGDLDGYM